MPYLAKLQCRGRSHSDTELSIYLTRIARNDRRLEPQGDVDTEVGLAHARRSDYDEKRIHFLRVVSDRLQGCFVG